ncbi:NAD-dependent epimerase/dehydratase family protein [Ensifer sp. P24N7]|uniref:NAD-dependent epimerase/dehydratase family protein n=1 Tax=Sinorhizobium sp. P24N7 TaxID=3348358 RepID=UPI0035F24EC0
MSVDHVVRRAAFAADFRLPDKVEQHRRARRHGLGHGFPFCCWLERVDRAKNPKTYSLSISGAIVMPPTNWGYGVVNSVLITGVSGFLGRHIPRCVLESGASVHTVGRTPWPEKADGVTFHNIDLLSADAAAFEKISEIGADTLVHVAWCTEPGAYWTSIDNLRWLAASLQLVQAFVQGGGRRIVVAGTCAEYDWSYHTLIERQTPLDPSTLYGQAKAALHKTLASYSEAHNISFAWGHIFFPYGPHEKRSRLLSDLIFSLLNGIPMAVSEGRQIRDFLHVADAAAAIQACRKRRARASEHRERRCAASARHHCNGGE